ncbi:MAG: MBG domain-containing protein [Gemmataceae bacterium]|nr:MBG domain-containing protein [Gemmataceae bacterium]
MSITRILNRRFWARVAGQNRSRAGRPAKACRQLQHLESRLVPTGLLAAYVTSGTSNTKITGTVYDDLDGNGTRNNGEDGVSGWRVYLDLDNSGTWNTDAVGDIEPSALTNVDGDYTISKLQPGTYRVGDVVQAGWTATAPAFRDVTVVNNKTSSKIDFLNFGPGTITGTVWNDENADGIRAKDPGTGEYTDLGLANWKVFLDINKNKIADVGEPATLTDADGKYTFSNVPPGDYEVTEVQPAGWDISPTFDIHQTASVVSLGTATRNFGNFSLVNGSITGTVWNDQNGDGIRAVDGTGAFTEPGLEGWTIFLDTNLNGVADPGESKTLTDADGNYSFVSVPAGDYEVTEVLPASWDVAPTYDIKTTAHVTIGEASTGNDFANFTVLNGSIRGTVWNDLNRNGIRDATLAGVYTDPGLAGWTVYLDLNGNTVLDAGEPSQLTDAAGGYKFADLQVGDYDVRETLPTGWETTLGFGDNVTVTVFSGAESVAPDFANFNLTTAVAGTISGTTWNDLNGNGVRDVVAGTGAFSDPGVGGRVVFIDLNGNGLLDGTEPNATSAADGSYSIPGVMPGSVRVIEEAKANWRYTAPLTGTYTISLKNAENFTGVNFGSFAQQDANIRGTVFFDMDHNGVRTGGERGLDGITVYLDSNNNGAFDSGEPNTTTSKDLFYTPTVNEAGNYSFTHLAAGSYTVRFVLPATLSATPVAELSKSVTVAATDDLGGVNCAAVFRSNEVHGTRFDDKNGNHTWDVGEAGVGGVKLYIDMDRDNVYDAGEPTTTTLPDGTYTFGGMTPGAYVIREMESPEYEHTYPNTTSGILWPAGTSNPAVGNVSPTSITLSLNNGQSVHQNVSITLPNTGSVTSMVDVFLLFDDTGSFVNNSPIVRAAFPTIISQLQSSLPGLNLGFGVGRLEEYGNFASEYATGRPFILNQPIVSTSTSGYMTAIQAALNRTTPGYGGDQPETDIEALYQLVTGLGFDGNNNGSVLDSGPAGPSATQLTPGTSGDVPSFASFTADPANNVFPAEGNIGGGGFRAGALPIVLLATDTGFAYQPRGETTITGVGGASLPLSSFTQTSRPTTPFGAGAGIQQTITGLNALGALVIGLGTNPQTNIDPRQGLSAISKLTGAVNNSTTTIANGTATPIAPGDPLYFQIASGFASSVANGVVSAIQSGVTSVAIDIDVIASDPRVHIVNHTGVATAVGSGQTATFDIEFIGDGRPARFDLQFVRAGTNVVIGSIPVVLGTPITGNCYEFEDLEDGDIHSSVDFGGRAAATTTAPTITVTGGTFTFDGNTHAASATATGIGGVTVPGSFSFTYNGSATAPSAVGVYSVVATFTSTDPAYSNGTANGTLTIVMPPTRVSAVAVNGGSAQRSRVTSVTVSFDQHVTLPATPESAFQLLRHSDNAGVTLGASVDDTGSGTVVTLSFVGGAVDAGSLLDGRYDLTVVAGSVTTASGPLDGNGDGTGGDNYVLLGDPTTNKLFRLFGDSDGDGQVAANDFLAFRLSFLTASVAFDSNNDGTVDANDFLQFRLRFLAVI